MSARVFAAVLAGGQGTRLGADLPKQFLTIGDTPVLIRTLRPFLDVAEIEMIFVVTPKDWMAYAQQLIDTAFPEEERLQVIEGGTDRSESLMQAIRRLDADEKLDPETILISHDAVRPFLTEAVIRENIRMCRAYGACATLIPATDTIVESRDGQFIEAVPDRRTMYQMQTPQTFLAQTFRRCYEALSAEEKQVVTDATGVLMRGGIMIAMVQGTRDNIKITFPEDLAFAAFKSGLQI